VQWQVQLLFSLSTGPADASGTYGTSNCQLSVFLPCRGEVADAVVMDKKNYGFVTFADPKIAMKFLEVCLQRAAAATAAARQICIFSRRSSRSEQSAEAGFCVAPDLGHRQQALQQLARRRQQRLRNVARGCAWKLQL
jgi:hypothetical protein